MTRWSRIATPFAIASPLATIFLVCAAFVGWFGLSTARMVEAAAINRQSETLSLIVSYVQHLIDDNLWNMGELETSISGLPGLPSASQLTELMLNKRSRSHIRAIVLLDSQGNVLITSNALQENLAAKLPLISARFAGGETQLFLPLSADLTDATAIPDIIFAKRLATGHAASIVLDVSVKPVDRLSSFNVANIDAAFAMIDTTSATPVLFGQRSVVDHDWVVDVQSGAIQMARPQNAGSQVLCKGNLEKGRQCIVYRRLANSPIMFAGLIEGYQLENEWIRESRPIWIFAALFLVGGASSSACILVWVRQRRRDRLKLAVALEDAQQAYAAKSNFMAHMSHELRTPLNSIVGFSDLLRGAFFGPLSERYRSYAEDIHFSATHLHKIVSEILELERLDQEKRQVEISEADLNIVAADAVRMLSILASDKGVVLEVATWPQPAIVHMDPHRAAQIGLNLVSNAVKYSEPGDTVVVTVSRTPQGDFVLVVADEGIGMTEVEIAYTAQPFGQPADRRAARHDSVGLGLPIVRGLLAAVGGHLVITSEKHKGTVVSAVFGPSREVARAS